VDATAEERFGVLDVGGGSSEYAIGTKRECECVVSCEIGAVRLTEAFPTLAGTSGAVAPQVLDSARSLGGEALAPALQLPRIDRLVLVGGSATTTVSLVRGKREFFTYEQLDVRAIETWIARLAATPLEQRKTLAGMNPQRADILLGGLLLIAIVAQASGVNVALVSTSDVLLGYLLRHPAER
jgi:exopolyphosphatase/guanosine-5'-triphosphate,3'-diphosphate pyrophosphatase